MSFGKRPAAVPAPPNPGGAGRGGPPGRAPAGGGFWRDCILGFFGVALVALGPPLAFLMIPGAAMFFLIVPIWTILALVIALLVTLSTGRRGAALGVALLVGLLLVLPSRNLLVGSVGVAANAYRIEKTIAPIAEAACAKDFIEPKAPAAGKPSRIIIDDLGNIAYRGYDPARLAVALADVEVVEVSRRAGDFLSAEAIAADFSGACDGARASRNLDPVMRGQGATPPPVTLDVCLRTRKIADPVRDDKPAIILRRGPSGGFSCQSIDIVEKSAAGETLLGRVRYNPTIRSMYPELRRRGEAGHQGAWFQAILRRLLGVDISDEAIRKHVVATRKTP